VNQRDNLFDSPSQNVTAFHFGEDIARVFDDMVSRSVPFYQELQQMTVELARTFAQSGTRLYDLGCSTGTSLIQLAQACRHLQLQLVGVDNSTAMLQRARQKLADAGCLDRCVLTHTDLEHLQVDNASVILMLLTLQFVRPARREALVRRLAEGLVNDGALILVEKTVSRHARLNHVFIERHHDFKKDQGYSALEIARKRDALENVLIPYRLDENIELLARNGFSEVEVFFRWYNFAGIVAVKPSRS
jgi:tRNA (cmo5U34)-methyltransferase